MRISFSEGSLLWEVIIALIILAASWPFALLLRALLPRAVKALTGRTRTTLDDLLLGAAVRPLFLLILIQGFFIALTSVSALDPWRGAVNKAWIVVAGAVAVYGTQRVVAGLVLWYEREVASRTGSGTAAKLAVLTRRFLTIAVYGIGGLLILDNVGVKLNPLLAGLGLGGLAVALALQPTLSNLIASGYMVVDGITTPGDFVEVQGGPRGTVVDVGWRSTKIVTPTNNLVIIPNGQLADSVVTNYTVPSKDMVVFVSCGVSYESDLRRVEAVALDVAQEILRELPDTLVAKDYEPFFLFSGFGDSNINFWVGMKAMDRGSSFTLTHEVVKRLHARFVQEGIEINYPVRKIVFSNGTGFAMARQSPEPVLEQTIAAPEPGDGKP